MDIEKYDPKLVGGEERQGHAASHDGGRAEQRANRDAAQRATGHHGQANGIQHKVITNAKQSAFVPVLQSPAADANAAVRADGDFTGNEKNEQSKRGLFTGNERANVAKRKQTGRLFCKAIVTTREQTGRNDQRHTGEVIDKHFLQGG